MHLSRPLENVMAPNTARVLRRLAMISVELSGRRIAELSEVPVVSAGRVLSALVEIGLVQSRDVGPSRLYALNREHVLWKPLESIMGAPATIEEHIARSVSEMATQDTTVAVFGSFARGKAGAASDIDIVIVSNETDSADQRFEVVAALQSKVYEMTGNRLDVIDITDDDLKRLMMVEDPLLDSWMREARTLSGPEFKDRIDNLRAR